MKKIRICCLLILLFPSLIFPQTGQDFKNRRNNLKKLLKDNELIFLKSNPVKNRNSDIDYKYRQDSNFYYLTGITEPNSFLLITKKAVLKYDSNLQPVDEILFIQERNPYIEKVTGKMLGFEEAMKNYKFNIVLSNKKLNDILLQNLKNIGTVYINIAGRGKTTDSYYQLLKKIKEENSLKFDIKNTSKFLGILRAIKSPSELECMQKAINITATAIREAMRSAEPGMYEYELEAVIEYVFRKMGAQRWGFPSIIGSGPNSCILHYQKNNRKIEDGDLILFDVGAEYNMYSADISRTIPANGKFSDRQKRIYNIVLKANEEAIKAVKPGITFTELNKIAQGIMAKGLYELGFIDKPDNIKAASKYTRHGISHSLGLDTHDAFSYGEFKTLKPSMVFTIEPGIYIPEEKIGIRIEDDILVTEDGYKVLSALAPKTVEEIEKLMTEKGIGNYKIK